MVRDVEIGFQHAVNQRVVLTADQFRDQTRRDIGDAADRARRARADRPRQMTLVADEDREVAMLASSDIV